jgi:hypothetical protein
MSDKSQIPLEEESDYILAANIVNAYFVAFWRQKFFWRIKV